MDAGRGSDQDALSLINGKVMHKPFKNRKGGSWVLLDDHLTPACLLPLFLDSFYRHALAVRLEEARTHSWACDCRPTDLPVIFPASGPVTPSICQILGGCCDLPVCHSPSPSSVHFASLHGSS